VEFTKEPAELTRCHWLWEDLEALPQRYPQRSITERLGVGEPDTWHVSMGENGRSPCSCKYLGAGLFGFDTNDKTGLGKVDENRMKRADDTGIRCRQAL